MRGDRVLANGDVPRLGARGQFDLADDEIDDAVHEIALVGDVVVQGHRLNAERARELPHRERLDPTFVREFDRGLEHPLAAQWDTGLNLGRHA